MEAELVEAFEQFFGRAAEVRKSIPSLPEPGLVDHASLQLISAFAGA